MIQLWVVIMQVGLFHTEIGAKPPPLARSRLGESTVGFGSAIGAALVFGEVGPQEITDRQAKKVKLVNPEVEVLCRKN